MGRSILLSTIYLRVESTLKESFPPLDLPIERSIKRMRYSFICSFLYLHNTLLSSSSSIELFGWYLFDHSNPPPFPSPSFSTIPIDHLQRKYSENRSRNPLHSFSLFLHFFSLFFTKIPSLWTFMELSITLSNLLMIHPLSPLPSFLFSFNILSYFRMRLVSLLALYLTTTTALDNGLSR